MTESTDLATQTEAQPPAVGAGGAVTDVGALLNAIMALAKDPGIDAAKLQEIRLTVNEARAAAKEEEFSRAKANAVRAMPTIRKDGRIVIADKNDPENKAKQRIQGHFERWPDVQRAITPHLRANNLTLTHRVDGEDGRIIVTAILRHDNGWTEESGKMPLPLDTSGGKNNVQGSGSAQSYGMRYSTRAILGLQFEPGHDDGELIALPDEPLNDQQQKRVAEAEALWTQDPAQFEEWWARLQPQDKAWMVQSGRYAEITGQQPLPGTRRIADAADRGGTQEDSSQTGNGNGNARETPEQWTEKYENHCRRAPDLDKLEQVTSKGAGGVARLKESGLTELYDRAVKAGADAHTRLSAPAGLFGEGED